MIVVVAVVIISYLTSRRDKERRFATVRENIILRSQNLDCAPDYLQEIQGFEGCVPKQCGRFVTDSLANKDDVEVLLNLAKTGLSYGGGSGGASILDLHSGALSKGEAFVNIYNIPEAREFLNSQALDTYRVSNSHAFLNNEVNHQITQISDSCNFQFYKFNFS